MLCSRGVGRVGEGSEGSVKAAGRTTGRQVAALACVEALILSVACLYGVSVVSRHSGVATAVYVAFVALSCALASVLWYVFVVRRPLCWGRPATPKRLAAAVIAAAVLAVLLEGGTLVGGPVSSPLVASDWHASRMAAFFVLCLPALCCIVLYDWRALARRWRAAVVACGFRLPKLFAAWLLAAVAAGLLAALA